MKERLVVPLDVTTALQAVAAGPPLRLALLEVATAATMQVKLAMALLVVPAVARTTKIVPTVAGAGPPEALDALRMAMVVVVAAVEATGVAAAAVLDVTVWVAAADRLTRAQLVWAGVEALLSLAVVLVRATMDGL